MIRFGVIGAGGIAHEHLGALRNIAGAELVALADVSAELLQSVGDQYGIPERFTSAEDLINSNTVDAVCICLPNFLHAPIAISALNAGLHVLCEKPMAATLPEARDMVSAAKRADKVLDIVFNHRRKAAVTAARQLIEQGVLGELYYARARWHRRKGIPGLGTWFTKQSTAGGGPMIDIGYHSLDMILHLLGEPAIHTVSAATYAKFGPVGTGQWSLPRHAGNQESTGNFEVEDFSSALIRCDNDITLILESSWATHTERDEFGFTLLGDKAGIEVNFENHVQPIRVFTDVAGQNAEIFPTLGTDGNHEAVIRDFIDTIETASTQAGTQHGELALRRSVVADAVYRSAASKREIVID